MAGLYNTLAEPESLVMGAATQMNKTFDAMVNKKISGVGIHREEEVDAINNVRRKVIAKLSDEDTTAQDVNNIKCLMAFEWKWLAERPNLTRAKMAEEEAYKPGYLFTLRFGIGGIPELEKIVHERTIASQGTPRGIPQAIIRPTEQRGFSHRSHPRAANRYESTLEDAENEKLPEESRFIRSGFSRGRLVVSFLYRLAACMLTLAALTTFFVFRIADGLVGLTRRDDRPNPTRLEVLSDQLSNLYVLLAWKGVPSSTLESCNADVAGSTEGLRTWEMLNRYRFLGNGMTGEEADSAALAEFQKQRRWIAEFTPDRIKNGCNKLSTRSDPEPGPGLPREALCPECGKAYLEAKQKWGEILAAEKMGKNFFPHEYPVNVPRCPLPETDFGRDKNGWYVTCKCGFRKAWLRFA